MINSRWRSYFFDVAKTAASLSYDTIDKVGAVAVRDKRIIATGYNGVCAGEPNHCQGNDGKTRPEVAHAEQNLIGQLAKSTESSEGCSVFVTRKPCMMCAVMLLAAGIQEVYCLNKGSGRGMAHLIKHARVTVYDPDTYEQYILE